MLSNLSSPRPRLCQTTSCRRVFREWKGRREHSGFCEWVKLQDCCRPMGWFKNPWRRMFSAAYRLLGFVSSVSLVAASMCSDAPGLQVYDGLRRSYRRQCRRAGEEWDEHSLWVCNTALVLSIRSPCARHDDPLPNCWKYGGVGRGFPP